MWNDEVLWWVAKGASIQKLVQIIMVITMMVVVVVHKFLRRLGMVNCKVLDLLHGMFKVWARAPCAGGENKLGPHVCAHSSRSRHLCDRLCLEIKGPVNTQIISALRGTEFVTFPENLYISGWAVEMFQFFDFYSWEFFSKVPIPFPPNVSPRTWETIGFMASKWK